MRSVRPENLRRELDVRFVDEEMRTVREVERVGAASVVGTKPRRDPRRYERRLGDLRVASCGVSSHLDHQSIADEQPLVCVVDDAQWLDQASADILGFVARRIHAERIAQALLRSATTGLECAA
jgi:hypothetical protein